MDCYAKNLFDKILNQFDNEKLFTNPDPEKVYYENYMDKAKNFSILMKWCLLIKKHPNLIINIQELLKKNKNIINHQTSDGKTVLFILAPWFEIKEYNLLIKLLLQHKPKLNLENIYERDLFAECIYYGRNMSLGYWTFLEYLLQKRMFNCKKMKNGYYLFCQLANCNSGYFQDLLHIFNNFIINKDKLLQGINIDCAVDHYLNKSELEKELKNISVELQIIIKSITIYYENIAVKNYIKKSFSRLVLPLIIPAIRHIYFKKGSIGNKVCLFKNNKLENYSGLMKHFGTNNKKDLLKKCNLYLNMYMNI